MFDKLKFWKKEEPEFGLGESGFGEPGVPGFEPKEAMGLGKEPEASPFGQEPGFGTEPGAESAPSFSEGPTVPPAYGQPPPSEGPAAFQQQQGSMAPDMVSKDLQLISSKLDTIKAQLEHMNQRIINIEKKAYEEERKEGW